MHSISDREATFVTLMNFHAAKRRLTVMMDARKRRGEPTDDLEVELAFNRLEAKAFAAMLVARSAP
jgi:hypothetical protein